MDHLQQHMSGINEDKTFLLKGYRTNSQWLVTVKISVVAVDENPLAIHSIN